MASAAMKSGDYSSAEKLYKEVPINLGTYSSILLSVYYEYVQEILCRLSRIALLSGNLKMMMLLLSYLSRLHPFMLYSQRMKKQIQVLNFVLLR